MTTEQIPYVDEIHRVWLRAPKNVQWMDLVRNCSLKPLLGKLITQFSSFKAWFPTLFYSPSLTVRTIQLNTQFSCTRPTTVSAMLHRKRWTNFCFTLTKLSHNMNTDQDHSCIERHDLISPCRCCSLNIITMLLAYVTQSRTLTNVWMSLFPFGQILAQTFSPLSFTLLLFLLLTGVNDFCSLDVSANIPHTAMCCGNGVCSKHIKQAVMSPVNDAANLFLERLKIGEIYGKILELEDRGREE